MIVYGVTPLQSAQLQEKITLLNLHSILTNSLCDQSGFSGTMHFSNHNLIKYIESINLITLSYKDHLLFQIGYWDVTTVPSFLYISLHPYNPYLD